MHRINYRSPLQGELASSTTYHESSVVPAAVGSQIFRWLMTDLVRDVYGVSLRNDVPDAQNKYPCARIEIRGF